MSPEARAAFERRRRARNLAIFAALIAMVALFYFVAVARIQAGLEEGNARRAAAAASGGTTAATPPNTSASAPAAPTDAARPAR